MNQFGPFIARSHTPKSVQSSGPNVTIRLYAALFLLLLAGFFTHPTPVYAQGGPGGTPTPAGNERPLQAPENVDVEPTARDAEIRQRLKSILDATGWFIDPEVQVREGVVFLFGRTETEDYKTWAGDLARNTQDVVAVVNQIELVEPSIWNFQPALNSLEEMWFGLIRSTPLIGFGLLIFIVTWAVTRFSMAATRRSLHRRISSPLLGNVAAYTVGTIVFLVGFYVVLRVAGLTSVAMTVVGGTGILGLVLGIAFRDITENFLASILLSIQNPFRSGDLVTIGSTQGFVQALTTRVTVLITLDGNLVQIPNATVYKSNIINFTSNPNLRMDFIIGIGLRDSITDAQTLALKVLEEHPAVLKDPEPWVLADSLGSATVNLRVFFWLDSSQHNGLKVKSSIIRLVKSAFQTAGITMPDVSREVIFPEGVPMRWVNLDSQQPGDRQFKHAPAEHPKESTNINTEAEAGLSSEAEKVQEQARSTWTPDQGENLLKPSDGDRQ